MLFFRTDCVFVDRLVDTRTYRELCREHCLHVRRIAGDDYRVPVHDLREGVSTPVQNLQRTEKEMSKTIQNRKGDISRNTYSLLNRVNAVSMVFQENVVEDVFASGVHASVV